VQARFTNGRSIRAGPGGARELRESAGSAAARQHQLGGDLHLRPGAARQAGNSGFGLIQSGALEASNVDITAQLVNMITAQRNFQANAQMISTSDQVTQTIINIR
jgi:flagellar hook protein FlgE